MKKLFWLVILLVLFTTGCSNINKVSCDKIVDLVMNTKNSKANTALKGYKMYIPTDMELVGDINNNNVLYSNNDKYYLYVDLISYYNSKTNDYKISENKEAFYSKILDNDKKTGYVLITKYQEEYFVEVMYNYSKIEAVTKDYNKALCKALIVLKNIRYNDTIIETLIGKNILKYDEEKYDLLGPTNETSDFLEWNYEDVDNELKDLDEDIIDIETEE